jgi:hypothetical protein
MTQEEFKQLQVGDQVSHPATGIRRITHIETAYDYDRPKQSQWTRPVQAAPTYTCAITVTGGLRMKIGDTNELPRLRKV